MSPVHEKGGFGGQETEIRTSIHRNGWNSDFFMAARNIYPVFREEIVSGNIIGHLL